MTKFIKSLTAVLGAFLTVLMAVIVIDVVWQVVTRFVLKNPSSYTEELAGFLLIWIGLLGASYALYTRAHPGIDLLTGRLRGRQKKAAELSTWTLVFLFALFILLIGGIRLVRLTYTLKQISPAIGMPMAWVYAVLPLSGVLMMIYSGYFIALALRDKSAAPADADSTCEEG